ncbi:MAG: beta-lactamase family protein [Actinomycetota bacterium]|nr:beta-lactamase family protein [Actinomycetota bacterium]
MVAGTCAPGFEAVRDAFAANFADGREIGAAVAATVDGRPVVELWGGLADSRTGRAWEEDTPVLVYSTTKGPTAVCALLLWQRGDLDLDAPVVDVWPEFAAEGKGAVTTRHLLTHQGGLPVFDQPIGFSDCHDPDLVASRLAAQAPRWEPGTAHGYHPLTYGWLVGEVVRRVSGRTVGRLFAEEVAGPLDLDFWIGLPPEREAAVARLEVGRLDFGGGDAGDPAVAFATALFDVTSLTFQAFANPPGQFDVESFNAPELHQAEWPAANGIGTARALARLYGELACDRVLSAATLDEAARPQVSGPDRVLAIDTTFGLGLSLDVEPGTFGHEGAGGSVAFADRSRGVGFAYVMNQLTASLGADRRSRRLVEALYSSL